jgi:hypothetical protein
MSRRVPRSTAFRTVFVCAGLGVSLLAGLYFAVIGVRFGDAYWAIVSLTNIARGLQRCEEADGRLPAATAIDNKTGAPSGWRAAIYQSRLVTFDSSLSYDRDGNFASGYDVRARWDSPANLRNQEFGRWLFNYTRNETDPPGVGPGKAGRYTTYYKAITGPGTAFDPPTRAPDRSTLPKGLVLVVRVEKSDTHWMEPGDLNVNELSPSEKTKRLLLGKDGYAVLFADGDGWVLSPETPISDLYKFFTIDGAKKFDRNQVLGPYRVLPR